MKKSVDRKTKPLSPVFSAKIRRQQTILLLLGVLFLVFSLASWLFFQKSATFNPNNMSPVFLTNPPSLQDLATQYPEYAQLLNDDQLDSVYKDFVIVYKQGGKSAALELARTRGILTDTNDLRLTLELDTNVNDTIVSKIEQKGMQVTSKGGTLVDILIPYSLIEKIFQSENPASFFSDISGLEHVVHIRIPAKKQGNNFQDRHRNPYINATAWQDAGFTGKGIKVGILDFGFGGYKDLLGTELPEAVQVKSFRYGMEVDKTGEVHGTGCAELIHSIAPDAELYFVTYGTDSEMAEAVEWLGQQDVKIISDSTGGSYGPKDGTGWSANLAKGIVSKFDILWVNSMGNAAQTHYEGTFKDTNGDGFHEFNDSGTDVMAISVTTGSDYLVLNWDDWEEGKQDFNLFLYNQNLDLLASSTNIQNGEDDSAETIAYKFKQNGLYYVAFYSENSTRVVRFDFFTYDSNVEFPVAQGSLLTPADANNVLAVGAISMPDEILTDYSSQGPTDDGRIKPDISAPTGMETVTYAPGLFAGTSASAPQVAGAAALVWQANPNFSHTAVKDFVLKQALDRGNPGNDNQYGVGRLWLGAPPGVIILNPTLTFSPSPIPSTIPVNPTFTVTPSLKVLSLSYISLTFFICCGALGMGILGIVVVGQFSGKPKTPKPGVNQINRNSPVINNINQKGLCPRCKTALRSSARFCPVCGYTLQVENYKLYVTQPTFCRHCGTHLNPTSKFCPVCGKPKA